MSRCRLLNEKQMKREHIGLKHEGLTEDGSQVVTEGGDGGEVELQKKKLLNGYEADKRVRIDAILTRESTRRQVNCKRKFNV